MTVTLCVVLWPVPGQEDALVDYEDRVLALLPKHNGRLLQRVRSVEIEPGPYEFHVIEFRDEASFDAYMNDPARTAHSQLREQAIARTEVVRVEPIAP